MMRVLGLGAALTLTAPGWTNAPPAAPPKIGPIQARAAAPQPPAAPSALRGALQRLALAYGEPVGIAVSDVDEGWTADVNGDVAMPQQSVSKLWVAVATLDAADRGAISLDRPVAFTDADRSVFFQPIVQRMTGGLYITSYRDLLRRAIVESDNAANDKLIRALGGAETIRATAHAKRLSGLGVWDEERILQARIAGLDWRHEFGFGQSFKTARAALTQDARERARDLYLAAPPDGASPKAIVAALRRLQRGELLSVGATNTLLSLMADVTTGPRRLRGGLPADWRIAHKTGTGQDLGGSSIGINDVGLLSAPDGRTYAVAVMIPHTRQAVPERLALMQAVARAVVESWRVESGCCTSPSGPLEIAEAPPF